MAYPLGAYMWYWRWFRTFIVRGLKAIPTYEIFIHLLKVLTKSHHLRYQCGSTSTCQISQMIPNSEIHKNLNPRTISAILYCKNWATAEYVCYIVLHFDTITAHIQSMAIVLGPHACLWSWEMAGGQFGVISECIIWIWRRCGIFVLQIVTVYAPTNHADSSWEANAASETFCNRQLA